MLATVVLCVLLGWYSYIRRQSLAVDRIRSLGGQLQMDGPQDSGIATVAPGQKPESLDDVVSILFLGGRVSNAELDEIVHLIWVFPNLQRITLVDTATTTEREERARARLPNIQLKVVKPVLDSISIPVRK
jgi:hypothetical protein